MAPHYINPAGNTWVHTQCCRDWCLIKAPGGGGVGVGGVGGGGGGGGGVFKNTYELLNLRAFKISVFYKNHIFQCMGKIFCVEFQRVPLKFHIKYLTHTLKDVDFIHKWKFKSS